MKFKRFKLKDLNKGNTVVQAVNDISELSDGHFTFKELYDREAILFSIICNMNSKNAWKARYHNDGSMYEGKFLAGINTPDGPVAFYFDIDPFYDLFLVDEINRAPSNNNWMGKTTTEDETIFKLYDYSKSIFENEKIKDK